MPLRNYKTAGRASRRKGTLSILQYGIIKLISTLIRIYQVAISPFLGQRCRYYPSCSEYARLSFHKYPVHVALRQSAGRLFRCTPFHPGGIDLP